MGHAADHQKLLLPHAVDDYSTPYVDLKDHILESIDEFEQEIEYALDNITQQAEQLINDGEVILTYGECGSGQVLDSEISQMLLTSDIHMWCARLFVCLLAPSVYRAVVQPVAF